MGYHAINPIGGFKADPTLVNITTQATPIMDGLVKDGLELNMHYAFKFCSPSRCSLQSGRNPIHVNVMNLDPTYYNADDPVAGFSGIPRNMTGMGTVMKKGGYETHFSGKW
jgi:arylsulfatase I/J